MVEIKTNFTVEEIAKSNFEAKNKFKIISIICIIIGAISIVPLFILVMNNDNFIFRTLKRESSVIQFPR